MYLGSDEIRKLVVTKNLVSGYRDLEKQLQPNGFDLTVQKIEVFEKLKKGKCRKCSIVETCKPCDACGEPPCTHDDGACQFMSGLFPPLRKGSEDRRARMNKLKTMLMNKGDKSEEQVIAQFCIEEGICLRKAKEYMSLLELAGLLK